MLGDKAKPVFEKRVFVEKYAITPKQKKPINSEKVRETGILFKFRRPFFWVLIFPPFNFIILLRKIHL